MRLRGNLVLGTSTPVRQEPSPRQLFPIWQVRVPNTSPQAAMFQVADNITKNAFYIAADEWTRKSREEWKVTKGFGLWSLS